MVLYFENKSKLCERNMNFLKYITDDIFGKKTAHRHVKYVAMLVEMKNENNRNCRGLKVFTFVVPPSCNIS